MSAANLRARHHVLGIVALSLFAALFTRLWYLQVLTTDEFELAAESGRTQTVILEAPRGTIYDRTGRKPLVENTRTIQVQVDYQDFLDLETPEQQALLRRLATKLTEDDYLRHVGVREADDPGARPEQPAAPTTLPEEGDAAEGDEGDEPAPTTTTTGPESPEQGSALDPTAVVADPEGTRGPPAGVATGADNPDGEGDTTAEPPEPLTPEILLDRIEDPRTSKFKPVPVATGVSEELELYLTEHPEEFPTVVVERVTARQYPYGALLAHVLGYVGPITEEELDTFQNDVKPYENDDDIGKTGIERAMEPELRGVPGRVVYEVDARNRPIRELSRTEPVPGRDVVLTIDINMQYLVEKGLAAEVDRRRGVQDNGCFLPGGCNPRGAASVALDPRDGQVLAMASYPTYDPELFVGGISSEDYQAIADPERKAVHNDPLLNRVIGGTYAPGSTFKLFSSYAGLATGLITPDYVYNDTGVYRYRADCPGQPGDGCSQRNAGGTPNGAVRLTDALRVSSDTYYYSLGDRSWRQRDSIGGEQAMQDQMIRWGLGNRTGVDLTGEASGRIPTPDWLWDFSFEINDDPALAEEAGTWTAGKSGNTMVGQGDVLLTPLQLAQGYATLANGGTIFLPQLVLQVSDSDGSDADVFEAEATGQVDLPPAWRDAMVEGFDGVTKSGTAARPFAGFDQSSCPIAGKTGTAQVTGKNDTSLFTAFAPTPTEGRVSTIAMATVFDEAGFGAAAAVPLTRRVLEPFAQVGCDIDLFGAPGSPWEAPLGGWFDVEAAQQEFVPGGTDTVD